MSKVESIIDFDAVISEVINFSINLEEDPTLPELGNSYLQKITSQCRNFTNRISYYIVTVSKEEKKLNMELKSAELDYDLKVNTLLSDDPNVRKQPSITDRQALAMSMCSVEYNNISELKLKILDIKETLKILKFKHAELQRTNNDIKMQRSLVKDDMTARLGGMEGYNKPFRNQDKTVPEGMPPVVQKRIDPKELLRNPVESLPEPIDQKHAEMIASFLNKSNDREIREAIEREDESLLGPNPNKVKQSQPPPRHDDGLSIDDLLA